MDPDKIIELAIKAGVLEDGILKKVAILPMVNCLCSENINRLDKIKKQFIKQRCLHNAYIVLEHLGTPCCEGIAYIISPNAHDRSWAKHCWNVCQTTDGDKYFDAGMEYAYSTEEQPHAISYYLINKYSHSDYKKLFRKDPEGGFISKAPEIKEKLIAFTKEYINC